MGSASLFIKPAASWPVTTWDIRAHAREGKRVRGDSFHQDTLLLCILNTPVLLSYAADVRLAVDYTV